MKKISYNRSEQFGMGADADQVDYVPLNPDKEKVIPDMAFHTPLILPFQHVRAVLLGYRLTVYEKLGDALKRSYFFREIPHTLEVFLELAGRMKLFHFISSFIRDSTLSNVSLSFAERASSMASMVSGFGRFSRASYRSTSTMLFRLRFSRLASAFRRSSKEESRRKAVCFLSVTAFIGISVYVVYANI